MLDHCYHWVESWDPLQIVECKGKVLMLFMKHKLVVRQPLVIERGIIAGDDKGVFSIILYIIQVQVWLK